MVADTISLKEINIDPELEGQYPMEFITNMGVLKISETDSEVSVAVVNGTDKSIYDYIEGFHLPKTVKFFNVTKSDFASFIGETANVENNIAENKKRQEEFVLDSITHDAPVINIINAICIEAINLKASDIHIECQNNYLQVRYRTDGILKTVKKLDMQLYYSISNRIKIMANMNTMEQRLPQDGRLTVSLENATVDLRVSTVPTTNGESIVLRLFNKSNEILQLNDIGFSYTDLKNLEKYVKYPHGLILLTGPTGSGKSTTLYALIRTMPAGELKIITIEDPVEQIITGVNQVQINEEINLTFDSMLRRVLRQDPNIIMVGEIRDNITAEIALRSALTGHLILSTLHTNDSISVIGRLENMGLEPYLIASVLRCSVAQRLVRKLCNNCAEKQEADKNIKSLFKKYNIDGKYIYNARGCAKCNYTGYSGRIITAEIFMVDDVIEKMIIEKKSRADMRKYAAGKGMKSIAYDALKKVCLGITSFAEAEREVLF